jgi:hypothetical protein
MSESIFRLDSPGIPLPHAIARERSTWPRALAALAFLLALGMLTIGSLAASGDEWSLARARAHQPPVAHSGPIDPNC